MCRMGGTSGSRTTRRIAGSGKRARRVPDWPPAADSIVVVSDHAGYNECDIKSERAALRQPGLAATVPK